MAFDPVGKARIEVEADVSGVRKGMQDAKAEVESFSGTTEKETSKITGAFGRMGKAASDFQAIVGKLLIPAAVVASVTGLLNRWSQLRREAELFDEALKDVSRSLADLNKQEVRVGLTDDEAERRRILDAQQADVRAVLDNLERELEKRKSIWSEFWRTAAGGELSSTLRYESQQAIEEIFRNTQESLTRLQERQEARRTRIAADAAMKRAKEVAEIEAEASVSIAEQENEIRRRIMLSGMDERERIIFERNERLREATRQALLTGADVTELKRLIEQEYDIRLEAYDEYKAKEDKIAAESAKRQAKKYEEELTRAFENAAATLNETLAGSFGSFNNLSDAARDIANAIERRSR